MLEHVIIALGDIYAQISRRDEIRELMRSTQAQVRDEPGCVYYAFAETLDDPGHFVLAQQWRDQAALDEHYRSEAFARYQANVGELLVRDTELRLYAVQESVRPVASSHVDPRLDD
jgi:quinol monooxygenase YgiN